ncbi:MAG TPA: hypothetical protein VIV84_00865 [Burkholderiaceae bacterium]
MLLLSRPKLAHQLLRRRLAAVGQDVVAVAPANGGTELVIAEGCAQVGGHDFAPQVAVVASAVVPTWLKPAGNIVSGTWPSRVAASILVRSAIGSGASGAVHAEVERGVELLPRVLRAFAVALGDHCLGQQGIGHGLACRAHLGHRPEHAAVVNSICDGASTETSTTVATGCTRAAMNSEGASAPDQVLNLLEC